MRQMIVRTARIGAASLAAVVGVAVGVAAQQAPPEPLEARDVSFPEFQERTLSNGARLIVVPQSEVPFVTLNLVVPGGSVADPAGREGTASFVAQLLDRGTAERSAAEFADELDYLGASLSASASNEWSTIGLATLTSTLDAGLELLAEVVLEPAFSDEEVELLRTRSLSGLQVELSQAAALAEREFSRRLYGSHPYGRLETQASFEAISRDDVRAYHDAWYTPDGALFVVAGAVDADDIASRLEEAFAGWSPRGVPAPAEWSAPPSRSRPEFVIVHKPGTVQAEVRAGHLLPGGDFAEYTALSVANQVLGGGASGRLFKVLREERGYTYGAYSGLSRARQASRFQAGMAVRTEVAGEAVAELVDLIEGVRDEALPADELADTQSFLTGVFPLQIETPQQVASQVTTNRLLGLPEDAIETYRSRVLALDTAVVRAAAESFIRPEHLVIVLVGDALQLEPQLATLGSIEIVDIQGVPLSMADLVPREASVDFDLSVLVPIELSYSVLLQGNAMGEASRTLERVEGGWELRSETVLGPQTIVQSVRVDESLGFVEARSEAGMAGQSMTLEATREGGRIVGAASAMGQEQAIDFEVSDDAVVADALELAVWATELTEGLVIELPVAVLQTGTSENVTLEVVGLEEVTVPAGTFEAWRIEISGSQPQTLWVMREAPHIPVRISSSMQPISLELSAIGAR